MMSLHIQDLEASVPGILSVTMYIEQMSLHQNQQLSNLACWNCMGRK